eukprot:5240621-Prymnesium_polylepis.1
MDSKIRDGVRGFAQIRDRFAKVLDTIRADSRRIRDRFAHSHSRFAQVRKDSRWRLHGSPCKMCVTTWSRHPSFSVHGVHSWRGIKNTGTLAPPTFLALLLACPSHTQCRTEDWSPV